MIKENFKKIIGPKTFTGIGNIYRSLKKTIVFKHIDFIRNYIYDFRMYYVHSTVFRQNTYQKLEAQIILKYHTIEKGLLHSKTKFRFGKKNIQILIKLLGNNLVESNKNKTQIQAAYIAMCEYFDLHKKNKEDISDYFPVTIYEYYKSNINITVPSTMENNVQDYFSGSLKDFHDFSYSRSSVRNFTGDIIPTSMIEKVIKLASNAPSVCNRQSSKVYHVGDKTKIDAVLALQGGMTGFTKNINQLLVVVSDRNYFYSVGERNQFFIDGGIFLMNLLYALHYYKIGACPANWGKQLEADKGIKKLLNLKESEKVICLVPIGVPNEKFKTCTSLRRNVDENLILV
tara:strand:- start:3207 stop:4238 length:1032 start_codon:yes stop_codon:yes gene_type:complete